MHEINSIFLYHGNELSGGHDTTKQQTKQHKQHRGVGQGQKENQY